MAKTKITNSAEKLSVSAHQDHGNLLTESLIGVADAAGIRTRLNLPQVLARLADVKASTIAFTGLQSHQSHAWHAFLVQVAAMACLRADTATPPTDAAWWTERLRDLAGGDAAWTLVVADLAQPAFMQPPVPEGSLAGFANVLATPGSLDLLVTAKNHDRKLESGAPADAEAWVFALVSLQTGQGYSGKANYGVFRMNGGLGNRPGIGVTTGLDLGAAFRRDVAILRDGYEPELNEERFTENGLALIWCAPWDGKKSLLWEELDPWAVECCRRVRLRPHSDGADIWEAVMASTAAPRVAVADDYTGNAGDPWTPIGRGKSNAGKSLTLPGEGFTYARMVDLLFARDWQESLCQRLRPTDQGDVRWYARALVRGQGKTEGWHERDLFIPAHMAKRLSEPSARDGLAKTAVGMVVLTRMMRLDILKPALRKLWEDAEGRIADGLRRLEQQVEERFFAHLWDHPDDDEAWRQELKAIANDILEADMATVAPTADRWKRISAAQARFGFLLYHKHKNGVFLAKPVAAGTPA